MSGILTAKTKLEPVEVIRKLNQIIEDEPWSGHYPVGEGGMAMSERLAAEVISLPIHAYLDVPTQDRIIDAIRRTLAR